MKVTKLRHLKTVLPKEPPPIEIPDDLPKAPFNSIFAGVRGSGKSVAMSTLLHKYRDAGCLQRCFLISPTYESNKYLFESLVDKEDIFEDATQASLDKVLAAVETDAAAWRRWQDHCKLWEEYKLQEKEVLSHEREEIDEELCMEMVECGLIELQEKPKYKYDSVAHPHFVLVIDDCQSSPIFNPSTKVKNNLNNILIRHRHVFSRCGISIMMAMQNWKMQTGAVARALRMNMTFICLWGIRDEKLIDDIHQEIGREVSKEAFYQAYDYATSGEKWNFLMIEFGSEIRLRRNLDEIILLDNNNINGRSSRRDGNIPEGQGNDRVDQGALEMGDRSRA